MNYLFGHLEECARTVRRITVRYVLKLILCMSRNYNAELFIDALDESLS